MCYNPNCCTPFNCPGCNAGGICQNLITNGLGCNQFIPGCNIPDPCGCPIFLKSDCVYYSGSTTPCLGIQTNSNLTNIIKAIDLKLCAISPPTSGVCPITVTGTTNQINVSTTGSGCSTNYQVGLSSTVTGEISTIQSQISSISTFLNTAVNCITTNTPQNLTITGPTSNCINIDFVAPASGVTGVLYSDYSDSTTNNTSWSTVKTYNVSPNTLSINGDELVIKSRFTCASPISPPGTPPRVRIQFNGVTILLVSNFDISNLNMMDWEISIVRISNTTVNILLTYTGNTDIGIFYTQVQAPIKSYLISMAGLNLSAGNYNIDCDIMSATAGDTICRFLEVDLIKKI